MRIAQISYHYLPIVGGQEVYIDNLNRVFRKLGIKSVVYQRKNKGSTKSKDVILVFRIPLIGRIIKKWNYHLFNFFLFLNHRRQLEKEDAIITHYAIHAVPLWNTRKKVIVVSHGVEWNSENPTVEDKLRNIIAKRTFNKFIIVANDTHYFRELGLEVAPATNYFKEIAPRKWFIPNCVDTTIFNPGRTMPELGAKKIILVPRQITVDRGIDLAIRSFYLFLDSYPDYDMIVAGNPGEKSYYRNCENLVKNFGLANKVIFLTNVSHDKMPALYSSADITLIPTLRREGTSLSALESMACGTPTVSTNVAGLRDLPTIQSEPNPEDLCGTLIKVIAKREYYAEEQMQKVRTIFNIENWHNAWSNVIESLLL